MEYIGKLYRFNDKPPSNAFLIIDYNSSNGWIMKSIIDNFVHTTLMIDMDWYIEV